ncbi:MAG: c-type cytochrome biogenesis protein CcmI [Betaproteobacteria bacterium]|nr:c-type cytochrome biogenesis protein CcmI [Betaproteobacteria bacterium]
MTAFWIIAGFLIAGALLFIVPPLLGRGRNQATATRAEVNLSIYRDQLHELDADLAAGTLSKEQYQSSRSDLEGRVLDDSGTVEVVTPPPSGGRKWTIAAVIAMPILTVALYLKLGKPGGLDAQHQTTAANQSQEVTQEQINAMVEGLAQKLKTNPDDVEGWVMLGRSYVQLHRYGDASAAYARAVALLPNNAQLLADYAGVLAMNNGQSMQGEPEKIIQQALAADPNNIKALALAGTAAFQRKEYRKTIEEWQKLLKLVPADSKIARQIEASIGQLQGLAGQSLAGGMRTAPGQSTMRPKAMDNGQ